MYGKFSERIFVNVLIRQKSPRKQRKLHETSCCILIGYRHDIFINVHILTKSQNYRYYCVFTINKYFKCFKLINFNSIIREAILYQRIL